MRPSETRALSAIVLGQPASEVHGVTRVKLAAPAAQDINVVMPSHEGPLSFPSFNEVLNFESSKDTRSKERNKLSNTDTRSKMVVSADLLMKGATLMQEACPRCGGVQIRYKGKVYCLAEDNLDDALSPKPNMQQQAKEEKQPETLQTSSPLRKMLEDKLEAVSKQLESTSDVNEQSRLLDLISKYVDTLQKLKS